MEQKSGENTQTILVQPVATPSFMDGLTEAQKASYDKLQVNFEESRNRKDNHALTAAGCCVVGLSSLLLAAISPPLAIAAGVACSAAGLTQIVKGYDALERMNNAKKSMGSLRDAGNTGLAVREALASGNYGKGPA